MARILSILAILIMAAGRLVAADTMTGIFNERIKSLQVQVDGDEFAPPVIVLDTGDRIVVSFDHLAEDREYLRYELVHCNANWQPSQLVDSEFLDGFNLGNIDDYDFSRATLQHYVHYRLAIPNEEVTPKVSGNYLLRIYPEEDPEDIWMQCRFMVSEQSAAIDAAMSTRTDIDFNDKHQQLSIAVDTERAGVRNPFDDMVVMVQQNGRYDNEVSVRHPLRMDGRNIAVYEHLPQLIFDAGNEYRRFETINVNYPTIGVEEIVYADPYYHMVLYPDESRAESMYLYDQTQHGSYKIREYNSADSDVEADYVVVHFRLEHPEIPDASIFIDGDLACRRFDPESRMTYNRATGCYERNMLLKQGAYNYQYLVAPYGDYRGYTAEIEGDKFQTSNEYLIKVYARNPGERADRLIGVTLLR